MFQTLTHPQDQQLRVLGRGLGLRAAGEARKGVPGPEPSTTPSPPPLPSNQYTRGQPLGRAWKMTNETRC